MKGAAVRRRFAVLPEPLQLPAEVRRHFRCVLVRERAPASGASPDSSHRTSPGATAGATPSAPAGAPRSGKAGAITLLCPPGDYREIRRLLVPLLPASVALLPLRADLLQSVLARLAGLGERGEQGQAPRQTPGGQLGTGSQESGVQASAEAGEIGAGVLDLDSAPSGAASVTLADIVRTGISAGASDIHLVPESTGYQVRLRTYGQLSVLTELSAGRGAAVIRRLKYLAAGAVLEPGHPGDYALTCRLRIAGRPRDNRVRVATMPTPDGEAASLRIFSSDHLLRGIADLGFAPPVAAALTAASSAPSGLLCVAGAMGAGKSTTVRALLLRRARTGSRCITLEEPVEVPLPGVLHVPLLPGREPVTRLLRHLVRHDPDVIMVGEIRDPDGLSLALELALLGRLVLATLHAESLAAIPGRLGDLGQRWSRVEPRLLACVHQHLLATGGERPGRSPVCTLMPGPLAPADFPSVDLAAALELAREYACFHTDALRQLAAWRR